jgi:ATP-binding cassette subfamily B protein
MKTNAAPVASLTVFRSEDHERHYDLKPLQFFKLLRRVFLYTRPHWRARNWLVALVIIRSIQLPLLAWGIAAIINGPIARHDIRGAILATLGWAAFAIFTQVIFRYRIQLAFEMGEAVICDMRNDLFAHLQKLTASFYNKMKVGRIISRVSSDLEAIRMGVQDLVFVSVVQLGHMIVCAALMFYYDRVLFAVAMAIAPFLWVLNRYFQTQIGARQRAAQESFSRVTATLAESVSGIRVTQGFVRQEINAGLFRDLVEDHSRYSMDVARASAAFLPLLELNSQIFTALLLLIGGYRVLNPHISTPIGSIVGFFFQATLFFEPVRGFGNQNTQALTAMVGAERVFRLLDTQPDWNDPPNALALREVKGRVEFRALNFGYTSERIVLKNVSFVAEPGQTVALVGHTGSGKTSIINLIMKSYLPTSGELLMDEKNVTQISSESLRRHLGVVLQTNFLFEGTVMDNIRFSRPTATDAEVIETARRLDFADLIEAMPRGFQTAIGEGGSGLSLGQRQLVCFARALLADPRILILDEATSSIDAITESRIQRSLTRLLRGRTSFVVAHRLSTIRQADLILVLQQGEIIERGQHEDLLARGGVYKELYTQFARSGSVKRTTV